VRAGDQRRQDGLLLRRRAAALHGKPAQHGGQVRLDHQAVAEHLEQHRKIGRRAAETAHLLGERQAEPAEFGKGFPVRLAVAARAAHQRAALLEAVFALDEALGLFLQKLLQFRRGKVHDVGFRYRPNTALARMFFWISFEPP
jgi:hypothetical protein